MHTIEDCPLRTFGCITTTAHHPFHILDLDPVAYHLLDTCQPEHLEPQSHSRSSISSSTSSFSSASSSSSSLSSPCSTDSASLPIDSPLHWIWSATISDLLQPDPDSPLVSDNGVHSCILTFASPDNQSLTTSVSAVFPPKRVQVCIHTSADLSFSDNDDDNDTNDGQGHGQGQGQEEMDSHTRLYLIKDVTEMVRLATAAKEGIRLSKLLTHEQQPIPAMFCQSFSSPCPSPSPAPSPSPSPSPQHPTEQDPHTPPLFKGHAYDHPWSYNRDKGMVFHDSKEDTELDSLWQTLRPSSAASMVSTSSSGTNMTMATTTGLSTSAGTSTSMTMSTAPEDPGLMILKVTSFGTVDHAYAIHQGDRPPRKQSSSWIFLAHDAASIGSMADTAVMDHIFPDDLRPLCQGLDSVCKDNYTVFCVRWRVHSSVSVSRVRLDLYRDEGRSLEDGGSNNVKEPAQRRLQWVEYEGELFDEWVDPTAVPDIVKDTSPPGDRDFGFVWTELTGMLSEGSPVLVIRPLTLQEAREQQQRIRGPDGDGHHQENRLPGEDSFQDGRAESRRGSRGSFLEMELVGVSDEDFDLSSWTVVHIGDEEWGAVSEEYEYRRRRALSSSYAIRVVALPLMFLSMRPSSPVSWSPLSDVAMQAWQQWSESMQMGQDYVRAWCLYLLDTTFMPMLETVSDHLNLLYSYQGTWRDPHGVFPISLGKKGPTKQDDTLPTTATTVAQDTQMNSLQQQQQHPAKRSGIDRAGEILVQCPGRLGGALRIVGSTWVGQTLRTKLEPTVLDTVADQVLDWWEQDEATAPPVLSLSLSWTSLPLSVSRSFLKSRLAKQ